MFFRCTAFLPVFFAKPAFFPLFIRFLDSPNPFILKKMYIKSIAHHFWIDRSHRFKCDGNLGQTAMSNCDFPTPIGSMGLVYLPTHLIRNQPIVGYHTWILWDMKPSNYTWIMLFCSMKCWRFCVQVDNFCDSTNGNLLKRTLRNNTWMACLKFGVLPSWNFENP